MSEGEVSIELQDANAPGEAGAQVYAVPQETAKELIALCCDVLQESLKETAIWDPMAAAPEMPQEIIDYIANRTDHTTDGSPPWTEYLDSYKAANQVPGVKEVLASPPPGGISRTCG